MPKTVRRSAATLLAAALLVLTGHAATATTAAGAHGGRQVAFSVATPNTPCLTCSG